MTEVCYIDDSLCCMEIQKGGRSKTKEELSKCAGFSGEPKALAVYEAGDQKSCPNCTYLHTKATSNWLDFHKYGGYQIDQIREQDSCVGFLLCLNRRSELLVPVLQPLLLHLTFCVSST